MNNYVYLVFDNRTSNLLFGGTKKYHARHWVEQSIWRFDQVTLKRMNARDRGREYNPMTVVKSWES